MIVPIVMLAYFKEKRPSFCHKPVASEVGLVPALPFYDGGIDVG